jgi:hypothetical protein
MADEENKDGKDGQEGQSTTIVVKIGEEEKTLTAGDIQELLAKQTGLQKKVEGLSGFEKILERYGVDTDTYLQHSEGAIAIASKLIDEGMIDEKGNIIKKEPTTTTKSSPFVKKVTTEPSDDPPLSKVEQIVTKALDGLEDRLKKIEGTQGQIMERDMRARLTQRFQGLTEEDLDTIFDTAFRDRTKSLSQHAEAFVKKKTDTVAELRRAHAQEFGIDLEAFDRGKKEKATGKDDAALLLGDKALSFRSDSNEKKISPKKATMEFFKRKLGG